MKKLFIPTILFSMLTLMFACKKENAIFSTSCCGDFLLIDDNEYLICNSSIASDIESGAEVKVVFEEINFNDCDRTYQREGCPCGRYFVPDGYVKIKRIKERR